MELVPSGVAVEGVGGNDDTKRLSDGETGTVLRRMNSAGGAALVLMSEKAGRGTVGSESVLLFEDGSEVVDPFIVNDDKEDEGECDIIERSRLDALRAFFEFPTGSRVIGRSDASKR